MIGLMIFYRSFAGILSAYGLALADVVHEAQEPCARVYDKGNALNFIIIPLTFLDVLFICHLLTSTDLTNFPSSQQSDLNFFVF